jgi:hypothetical protein
LLAIIVIGCVLGFENTDNGGTTVVSIGHHSIVVLYNNLNIVPYTSLTRMTELVDLITDPQQRITVLMDKFIARLEEQHREEERQLEKVMEHFRLKLHRQHEKALYGYKKIFDEIYVLQVKNKDALIIEFFERLIRAEDKSLYADVFDHAIPAIQEIEKNGGSLLCSIQRMGQGQGCLYSNRKDGHFDFFYEDFDGFDKTRKEEKERENEEWLKKWRLKQLPKNEVILEDLKNIENEEPKTGEPSDHFINVILRESEQITPLEEDLKIKTMKELEEQKNLN